MFRKKKARDPVKNAIETINNTFRQLKIPCKLTLDSPAPGNLPEAKHAASTYFQHGKKTDLQPAYRAAIQTYSAHVLSKMIVADPLDEAIALLNRELKVAGYSIRVYKGRAMQTEDRRTLTAIEISLGQAEQFTRAQSLSAARTTFRHHEEALFSQQAHTPYKCAPTATAACSAGTTATRKIKIKSSAT